jgi:hypothetical protein
MCRWSLRSLLIVVAVCGVLSRVASEAVESHRQASVLDKLRGIGPAIPRQGKLPVFC